MTARSNEALRVAIIGAAAMALSYAPANAQDTGQGLGQTPANPDFLAALKSCQGIAGDEGRLACFDARVAEIVAANEAGEVQIVKKEDVQETRRKLFGFSLPKIGLFGGGDDEADELLETTITSARYLNSRTIKFKTAEGATWQINNPPSRLRRIKEGDTVVFKKAALGTYFIRIDGQTGVKGRRVE